MELNLSKNASFTFNHKEFIMKCGENIRTFRWIKAVIFCGRADRKRSIFLKHLFY